MAVHKGSLFNASFFDAAPEFDDLSADIYFGPAMRKTPGTEKTDVLGTQVLWVDADDPTRPLYTLPPTALVQSGRGFHLYWMLDQPCLDLDQIESANKLLAKDVPTGDPACWNANRILRVPGSLNTKREATVVLQLFRPEVRYSLGDFAILDKLEKTDRHKIRTGDSRGFRSRSERDWSIVTALVDAGASDELIAQIFAMSPCGDKTRDSDAPEGYLQHTIERARARKPHQAKPKRENTPTEWIEAEDGYYIQYSRGRKRISTFTFDPTLLLDGSIEGAQDAIVGTVTASGFSWQGITFSREAFTTVAKLDKMCPIATWQFLGRDEDVRTLLPYLMEKLQQKGLPRVVASPVLGFHTVKGVPTFLGDHETLRADERWEGFDGPMAWLPSQKEHPTLKLLNNITKEELKCVGENLPLLNEEGVIWPMIGWYAASCLKPWLESHNYRFPILNVVGTKGSGKTTLIQRVFMPLFGQVDPKSYDAGTTRFVILALLGSTNAVPIAFSEFRYSSAENFIRYILLAYDTGHDPRGRGDQTTVDYPLMAPFSVDGEDLISDPAARERIIVALLHPGTVAEGGLCYEKFNEFRQRIPRGFGGFYIQHVLSLLASNALEGILERARSDFFEAFPGRLPDRVRNNHVVALFGARLWADTVKVDPPSPKVFGRSVQTVFNTTSGRSRTLVDDMVEDIANAASSGQQWFAWTYDVTSSTLFFQLASAVTWWATQRRRQGKTALERDALRAQFTEAPYCVPLREINNVFMYGIDLEKAQAMGLDLPRSINEKVFTLHL